MAEISVIKKLLIITIIMIVVFPLVNAELIFEKGTEADLKLYCSMNGSICSAATDCNISIKFPDGSYLITSSAMTNQNNGDFNITLNTTQTAIEGEYRWDMYCCDGDYCDDGHESFFITTNGKEKPSGIIIVLFSVLFLGILASLVGLILHTLAHFVEKDFDTKDLILNISAYFVLWGIYILGKEYVGNYFINTFLEWLIGVGAITNVIFPLVIFVISITIWKWREELEGKF